MEGLQKLIKSRAVNLDPPAHFDKTNIEAVFGMLDPTRRGVISFEQYKAGKQTQPAVVTSLVKNDLCIPYSCFLSVPV